MGVNVREKPKGSGVYYVFIEHQGKRKAKKVGKDKRQAIQIAKKIEAKLTLGDLDLLDKEETLPLFEEYANYWLENYIKTLRRSSTYERYRDMLNRHIFPVFGKKPIDQIKKVDIKNLILQKSGEGLGRSMICLIRDVISGPMGYAVDEELLPGNPVSGVLKRLQLEREKRVKIEPLNEQEVQLFLDTCQQPYFREHYEFFLCAYRTGMRLGELLGLKWGDIDWNQKFIRVERTYKRGRFEKPKNGKVRRVDMSDQLFSALRKLLTERKKDALKLGLGAPVEFVFHRKGNPMEQNYIRRIYKRILTTAGIRNMRLHDIRHTYASLLLSQGESPVYVKEQLGHHSIQITVDVYGHLIPSSNRGAVNRLDTPQQTATYPQPVEIKKP
ncbi:MAG: site-specific integrase [Deltaproteobacteria bacterium]|nr:site-specific integrase [Deltaproteobacteria bacterium]